MPHSLHHDVPIAADDEGYPLGRSKAWFAFAMTFGLMTFDYIDRQIVVSLFPHLKLEWTLSDKQLGSLVSIVSIVVAAGAIPVALFADRFSRVKSIFLMAVIWSLATVAAMFASDYSQLFASRGFVGLGEAGYGAVGAALLASLFPQRHRATMLGTLAAASSIGAVLGVVLGGFIVSRWGWRAAFGVVGTPGLLLAFLYLLVPDSKTSVLASRTTERTSSLRAICTQMARALTGSRTLWCTCLGAASQLILISTIWSWLPTYLVRNYGASVELAAKQAGMVVLLGGIGAAVWGFVADRLSLRRPRNKFIVVAGLSFVTVIEFMTGFSGILPASTSFVALVVGGFMMTCTFAPTAGIVMDLVHPGIRSTGTATLSVFQNLLGLAVGPFVCGALSDAWGLRIALFVMPLFGFLATACFLLGSRSYEREVRQLAMTVQSEGGLAAPARHAVSSA